MRALLLRLVVLWLLALATAPAAAAVQTVALAESAEGPGPRFPEEAERLAVTLPDDWWRTRPGSAGPVWYRVPLQPQAGGGEPMGVLAAHACSTVQVLLNGHPVYSGGRLTEPYAQDCPHPLLVPLPAALLRAQGNVLDIQVLGHPLAQVATRHRAAGISELKVGALVELQREHHRLTLLTVTLPQALGATLLLMGGFMFVLGFINRRESHLAYFGALSVGWALHDAPLWVREWPLAQASVELLLAALLPLLAQVAVQFLLRYARARWRVIDTALPLQAVVMPLTLVGLGPQHLHAATMAWTAWLSAQVAAAAVFYLLRHRQRREFWPMAALLALLALAGGLEAVAQVGVVPLPLLITARLLVPVALVLLGLRLVQQHGHALRQSEQGRAQLEQRVREATAEIERNFRQLSELKIEQVTERERKRIAADLHDDLGAKLLTIVHTSENERIATLAREALEEMRLSVRGLTGRPVRLADALGDWRAEVVSRLAQAGIEAEWSAPDDLPQTLSARAYVQTTRILREATSNIIKHSGASYCAVRCQVADGDFQLVVQDNGEGISSEPDGRLDRGHGMATMKQRAKQLQGQCLVESGPGFGTVIRLTLPLDRALEST